VIALTGGELHCTDERSRKVTTFQARPCFFQGCPIAEVPRLPALGWELTGTEVDGWALLFWSGEGKPPRPTP